MPNPTLPTLPPQKWMAGVAELKGNGGAAFVSLSNESTFPYMRGIWNWNQDLLQSAAFGQSLGFKGLLVTSAAVQGTSPQNLPPLIDLTKDQLCKQVICWPLRSSLQKYVDTDTFHVCCPPSPALLLSWVSLRSPSRFPEIRPRPLPICRNLERRVHTVLFSQA